MSTPKTLKRELSEARLECAAWRECAGELANELWGLGATAQYLMRQPESQFDFVSELEGVNKALAAYTNLKNKNK